MLPGDTTYQVSMIPDTSYIFPFNITSSAQVTIRVPHGEGSFRYEVVDLETAVPGTDWEDNARVDSPPEAPGYDYISFGLITLGTDAYDIVEDVEIPLFTFRNGGDVCAGFVELINNETDPFMPPNSFGANIGNAIAILGAGLTNAYTTNFGDGKAPCTPEPDCFVEESQNITLCPGQDYNGVPIVGDTTITQSFISALGCDSTLTTNISLSPSDTTFQYNTVCDENATEVTTASMTETLSDQNGCDSTVVTITQIAPTRDTTIEVSIPQGAFHEGVAYENDTLFTETYNTAYGCDSTVTTIISIVETPTSTTNVFLCEGETYEGITYESSTSLVDTLQAANGGDSLVITNIEVASIFQQSMDVSLCGNEEYEGIVYESDTTLVQEFQTVDGCDSTITTNIMVMPSYENFLDTSLCAGAIFNGFTMTQDTTFSSFMISSTGCDSIIHVQLSVVEAPVVTISGKTTLCGGESTTLSVGDFDSYLWSDGSTTSSIDVAEEGNYSVTVTNTIGCESSADAFVSINQMDVNALVSSSGCDENALGVITFQNGTGEPLMYSINGGQTFLMDSVFSNLSVGTYSLVVEDTEGCLWEESRTVEGAQQLLVELGDDMQIQLGDSISINTVSNQINFSNITWSPAISLSCSDCPIPMASPMETTMYEIVVTDMNGCTATDNIQIFVDNEVDIYIPNAFSPNGDGQNDELFIFAGEGVAEVKTFKIFNRWGGLLFEKNNFQPNDGKTGWDGRFRNRPVQPSVVMYFAEVELVNGLTTIVKGDITIVD